MLGTHLSERIIIVLFSVLVSSVVFAEMATAQAPGTCLYDDFSGSELDTTTWDVFGGSPTTIDGSLQLNAEPGTRAEIQSKTTCSYGVFEQIITSSNWKSQDATVTDSSFGFEHFTGTNGQCHYALVLVANGHLRLLRADPDEEGNCEGDPEFQAFIQISNWEEVRAQETVHMMLTWEPNKVELLVSDGGTNSGAASYMGDAIPNVPLKIRLNADCMATTDADAGCTSDTDEAYAIDFVRVLERPMVSLELTGCTNCQVGDIFSVRANVNNPSSGPISAEVKAGVVLPDGTESNEWKDSDKHFEFTMPAGYEGSVEILRVEISDDRPKGTWLYEGALLSPELGRTLTRGAKIFTIE